MGLSRALILLVGQVFTLFLTLPLFYTISGIRIRHKQLCIVDGFEASHAFLSIEQGCGSIQLFRDSMNVVN